MRKFDTKVQHLKYKVLREVARLALEKIVELESIDATDDEVSAEFENLAKAYNMSADEVKKFVENEAVKADLCVKKAVDLVKANADVTAANKVKTDAENALANFIANVELDYTAKTAELEASLKYKQNLANTLGFAVNLYLSEDALSCAQGEAKFVEYLEEQLKAVKATLINYEYAVAHAEYKLQLVKDGDFTAAENVATIKAELETLEAEKADIVAALNAAIEELAKAEEIWFAAE